MKTRIVIFVEGGIVQSVLSDSKEVSVEVIDLDTDDESEAACADAACSAVDAELASGALCCVY